MATDHIQAIIGPLKEKRALVQTEIEGKQRELEDLRKEAGRIDRVLRAAGDKPEPRKAGEKSTTKRQRKSRAGSTTTKVAPWRNEAVKEALDGSAEPLTSRQLAESLGWSENTTTVAVKQARDAGLVRVIGMRGGKGGGARLYGATDKVYEPLTAAAANGDHAGN